MMEVWNSHGKWEVPKPYLIGGSADPMLVCIGDAQILTLRQKIVLSSYLSITQFIWSDSRVGFNSGLSYNPDLKPVIVIKPIVN